MYLALRLRSLCSRSAKIAMHISQIGIISAGLVRPWPRQVSRAPLRGTSAVTYHTNEGNVFAFRDAGNAVTAYKITAINPPGIVSTWSMGQSGRGSPCVTTTDGHQQRHRLGHWHAKRPAASRLQ